jgi:UDP-GlcNAc:undecaprenyl-phosphate GlcNAc-1-phosphate transferase
VGAVISVALAVMALMLPHREVEAVVALSLAGSLLAFLVFNFPPASIFLGDAGSTIIGLVIGVLALRSGLKGPATIALAAPIAIFAIPIFDTGMAILRRKLTGRSLYTADRGHLHHCLLRRGLSSRRTAISIGTLCACTAAVALISVYRRNELLAIIGTTAVLATLVFTGLFGHSESRILWRRLAQAVRTLLAGSAGLHEGVHEERRHVAGKHAWDALWDAVVIAGRRCNASSIRLHLDVPSMHEEFHALLDARIGVHADDQWYADLPLLANGHAIGRLQLGGSSTHGFSYSSLAEFIPMLERLLESLSVSDSQTTVAKDASGVFPAAPTFPTIDASPAADAVVHV